MFEETNQLTQDFQEPIPLQVLLVDKAFHLIPKEKGVYMILRNSSDSANFLENSVGGHFKKRNPTVFIDELSRKWVPNTNILYIGQCGSGESTGTLHSRIKDYIKYGSGKPVGHHGGRYIWQLSDYMNLYLIYKTVSNEDPREVERGLIQNFIEIHGVLPFANLRI